MGPQLVNDAGGLAALALALFFVARSIRADARFDRRLAQHSDRLEERIKVLEAKQVREERRRYQLEAILRAAGIPIPPWPDDDTTDGGVVLIPRQRSAS